MLSVRLVNTILAICFSELFCRLSDLGYRLVSKQIFGNSQLNDKLLSCVKEWLTYERTLRLVLHSKLWCAEMTYVERSLEHTERHVMTDLIKILLRHHQYSAFEPCYMDMTSSFCLDESKTQAERLENQPDVFFKTMQDRVEAELQRAKAVLPISAWSVVREVTERALWQDRMDWVAMSSK